MIDKKIVIIDYWMWNTGSILNIVKKVWWTATITSDKDIINQADKIILPGVWKFDKWMENIENLWLVEILKKKVIEEETPILWICLWFQLFWTSSQEWLKNWLNWLNAKSVLFDKRKLDEKMKVPHMWWNYVQYKKKSKLTQNISDTPRYYFVHSYHMICEDQADILGETMYWYNFVSSINKWNIYWTQFHPEKSHKFWMELFSNFVNNI